MELLFNKIFLEHETGNHPENKNRLDFLNLKESKIGSGEKYLPLIYSDEYINNIKEACKESRK